MGTLSRRSAAIGMIVLGIALVVALLAFGRGSSDASRAASGREATASPAPTASADSTAAPAEASPGAAAASEGQAAPSGVAESAAPVALDPGVIERAECGLRRSAIDGLISSEDAATSTVDDRLRDAVQTLQDNLADWQQAREVRPELGPAIDAAAKVLTSWRAAVVAFDAGDQPAADAAIATANAELTTLERSSNPDVECSN